MPFRPTDVVFHISSHEHYSVNAHPRRVARRSHEYRLFTRLTLLVCRGHYWL